jgi:hypothetical protein
MLSSGSGNRWGYNCCHDSTTLFAKPFYSATTAKALSGADVSQGVAVQEPATETVSIVASPTIETDSQFFFGSGDGSSGYYAERPEPTLELVRYARMP